jgi:hypothetical protein
MGLFSFSSSSSSLFFAKRIFFILDVKRILMFILKKREREREKERKHTHLSFIFDDVLVAPWTLG